MNSGRPDNTDPLQPIEWEAGRLAGSAQSGDHVEESDKQKALTVLARCKAMQELGGRTEGCDGTTERQKFVAKVATSQAAAYLSKTLIAYHTSL